MQVRVLCFGALKDWLGAAAATVDLAEGATVATLLNHLQGHFLRESGSRAGLFGIAVSVNTEFVTSAHVLHENDEVGLLPPVSGGASSAPHVADEIQGADIITLIREPIDSAQVVAAIKQAEDGAIVVFDGIVRNQTRGRKTLHLDYESYEEMALKQMCALAADARTRFGVRQVVLIHRLGKLVVGETSVLIVVASAHRAAAFDASRWLIDTLKKQVPIWKKETFEDGAVWADGEPFPASLALDSEAAHEG